jgi:beta-1,4-N-acetylglucosaminyltransferase
LRISGHSQDPHSQTKDFQKSNYRTMINLILPAMVLVVIGIATILLFIRLAVVMEEIWRHRKQHAFVGAVGGRSSTSSSCSSSSSPRTSPAPLRTLIILGSGGHTTEMLTMTRKLPSKYYYPILYCKASTDATSHDRLRTFMAAAAAAGGVVAEDAMNNKNNIETIPVYDIPRSREVGQSYFSSVFTTIRAFGASVALVYRLAPDLILCNGPGTCLPICLVAFLFRLVRLQHATIVFVESFCRVQSLSLTGKILYYTIADVFLVHWTSLHTKFPHSVLTSAIVQNSGKGTTR